MILKDVCNKITDGSHNPPQGVEQSEYLMISSKNVFDDRISLDDPRYLLEEDFYIENRRTDVNENDLLMTIVGTVGRVAVVPNGLGNICLQRSVAVIKPKMEIVLPRYLMYYLQSRRSYLEKEAHGVAQKGIYLKQLEKLDIYLPTLEQQKMLIRILDTVSVLISQRKQQLEILDELVKVRFVEMFGIPGTDEFGWKLAPLGSVCFINPKKSQDSRLGSGIEVSFVPMPAVTEHGEIDATSTKDYDEVKSGFTYFAENDVLFAKITPCMENGKGAVARGLCNGIGFGSTEFHVLRPISGKTNPYWIYMLTAFSQFREDAAKNMTGSAGQRRVPASFLENYRVAVPPIELQEQFATFVEQTDKSKVEIRKSLDKLEILKKALMQKYFG